MKKTLLIAAFAFVSSFAFAQKPTTGGKTAEVNLNLQFGAAALSYNAPELRFRYFLSDNAAVRLRMGLGSSSAKSSVTNGTTEAEITDNFGFGLLLAPGYEMHLPGTDKLSPYIGGQLGINFVGGATKEVTNSAVAAPTAATITVGNKYSSKAGSDLTISLGLMMGADYYITDAIYVGGEFGLGLFSIKSTGEGKTDVTVGTTLTSSKTLKSSSMDLFGVTSGGVRLGFIF